MSQNFRVRNVVGLMLALALFVLADQRTVAAQPNPEKNHSRPVRVVGIRFGEFGGFLEGGYTSQLQVSDGQATLYESWTPVPQRQHPNLRVRADLSTKHWQEIQALVDRDAMLSLPDRTSCASCVDGVDEFVEVEFSDHTKKSVTFAAGDAPKELKDLRIKLIALEEKLAKELPPGGYNPR